jgi:hypothetical protein
MQKSDQSGFSVVTNEQPMSAYDRTAIWLRHIAMDSASEFRIDDGERLLSIL